MPNPKGILALLQQMQKGRTGQLIGKNRSEAGFARKRYPGHPDLSRMDREEQIRLLNTDIPYGKRSPIQQGAMDLLAKAIKASKPRIKDSTARTQAQELLTELRRSQQGAIEARKLNKFREAAEHEMLAKQVNKEITNYVKRMRKEALAVPALAKMAEATMMPEPSFGEKTGEFLMDWVSPVPRSWGQADPKMRVD
tara:strand:+ start:62 stop:649 length:588 start_codon:yes stop_codon:yes gene_type:complete